MGDIAKPGYSKMNSIQTGISVDNIGTMNNNRSEMVEDKVNILVREKQTKKNPTIRSTMPLSKNRTSITSDKITRPLYQLAPR